MSFILQAILEDKETLFRSARTSWNTFVRSHVRLSVRGQEKSGSAVQLYKSCLVVSGACLVVSGVPGRNQKISHVYIADKTLKKKRFQIEQKTSPQSSQHQRQWFQTMFQSTKPVRSPSRRRLSEYLGNPRFQHFLECGNGFSKIRENFIVVGPLSVRPRRGFYC